jgi:hypothetical protein
MPISIGSISTNQYQALKVGIHHAQQGDPYEEAGDILPD